MNVGKSGSIQPQSRHTNCIANGPSASVETLVTINFEEKDGKTVQTFHQRPFLNAERRDSHVDGWTSSLQACGLAQITKEHSA